MERKRLFALSDSLMVLLNIASPYTIIPCLLFTRHVGVNSALIAVLTFIYLLCRFRKTFSLPHDCLFVLFVVLNFVNICVAIVQETFAFGFLGTYVANILFYCLLFNMYNNYSIRHKLKDSLSYVFKGYSWLCFYQLIIVALMLLFTDFLHLFNPLINDISYKYDIFSDNVDRLYSGLRYYFPYNLCLFVVEDFERLPFLHSYGIITGIFHEPHTMTYYIVPFLFLLSVFIVNKTKRFFLYFLFFIYMIVAASTTNLLCVSLTLFVALSIKNTRLSVLLIVLLILGFSSLQFIDNPILDLIRFKFESGSKDYSESTLLFAFSPETLFGSNFLSLSYVTDAYGSHRDVGFIIFILNLLFLLVFIRRTTCLCLSGNKMLKAVGLFSVYFIFHSSKLALRTYTLEMLMFVIFVVTICYNQCQFERNVQKSGS